MSRPDAAFIEPLDCAVLSDVSRFDEAAAAALPLGVAPEHLLFDRVTTDEDDPWTRFVVDSHEP